jgi:hypothetical protein
VLPGVCAGTLHVRERVAGKGRSDWPIAEWFAAIVAAPPDGIPTVPEPAGSIEGRKAWLHSQAARALATVCDALTDDAWHDWLADTLLQGRLRRTLLDADAISRYQGDCGCHGSLPPVDGGSGDKLDTEEEDALD